MSVPKSMDDWLVDWLASWSVLSLKNLASECTIKFSLCAVEPFDYSLWERSQNSNVTFVCLNHFVFLVSLWWNQDFSDMLLHLHFSQPNEVAQALGVFFLVHFEPLRSEHLASCWSLPYFNNRCLCKSLFFLLSHYRSTTSEKDYSLSSEVYSHNSS